MASVTIAAWRRQITSSRDLKTDAPPWLPRWAGDAPQWGHGYVIQRQSAVVDDLASLTARPGTARPQAAPGS
jgi:hypothetical protein